MKKVIAFDLSSGDKGTAEALKAAVNFCNINKEWKIVAFSVDKITSKLPENLEIIMCSEIIGQNDSALEFKRKKDSTLFKAIELVASGEADGLLSPAASGPLVTATYLTFRTIANMKPAYAAVASSAKGELRVLLDAGANMSANSEMLNKYAFMGSEFAKIIGLSKNPIVKMLNVGSEDSKGTSLQKEAFELMKNNKSINFQGNIEANKIISSSDIHVIVTDAFSGNIVVKAYEGAFRIVGNIIKSSVKESFIDKAGFLLAKKFRKQMKIALNDGKGGGGVVLGLNNLVVKAHGSSNEAAFTSSLNVAKQAIELDLINVIKEKME